MSQSLYLARKDLPAEERNGGDVAILSAASQENQGQSRMMRQVEDQKQPDVHGHQRSRQERLARTGRLR